MKYFSIFIFCLIVGSSYAYKTKALYGGEDSRVFIEEESLKIKKLGLSVAAKIPKKLISLSESTRNATLKNITLEKALNLCPETDFAEELSLAKCGGFLIAPDLLVTAGHCSRSCDSDYWVFDFKKSSIKNNRIKRDSIYQCKKVVSFSNQKNGIDYAIVQLNRKVEKFRKPLKLNINFKSKHGSKVFMLGHAEGMPLLYSDGRLFSRSKLFFRGTLDSFGSSSGSPVFDRFSNTVVGILVAGERDYILDDNRCRQYFYCAYDDCSKKERVLRLNTIPGLETLIQNKRRSF